MQVHVQHAILSHTMPWAKHNGLQLKLRIPPSTAMRPATAAAAAAAAVDVLCKPDGVVVGNYRCSLAGLDLNRVYQAPDSRLQPVICAFKDMVREFMQEREVRRAGEGEAMAAAAASGGSSQRHM